MTDSSRVVAVRFFAAAKAVAGTSEAALTLPDSATLADLEMQLVAEHGPALAAVLANSSFLVDGVGAEREDLLAGARTIDVLPPFAGG